MNRSSILALLLSFCICVPAPAQTKPVADDNDDVVKVRTNLVQIDAGSAEQFVVVPDLEKQGLPLSGIVLRGVSQTSTPAAVIRNSLETKMRKPISLLTLLLFCSVTAFAQHTHHTAAPAESMETQDWAKQKLAKSSRHQEWVKVKAGAREVSSFVVYPEVKHKATAVIVIHEIFGMSDWVQSLTDQLAEAGYIAIAPDLLSGMGPNGGGTSSMERSTIGPKIRDLPPDQITADLNAVVAYVGKLPAANGKVVVAGYCWGGAQAFRFAGNNANIKAAYVFYGNAPMTVDRVADKEVLGKIKAPVYGFYAGNDARINETLPTTTEAMKALNKKFDPVIYDGSGHGFMRAGDAPEPVAPTPKGDKAADTKAAEDYQKALAAWKGNKKARDEAWARWKKLLASV